MPELPDVEGFRRRLARHVPGRRVVDVSVADRGVLRNTTPQGLGRSLKGRRLARPLRFGKWLEEPTEGPPEGPLLLFHFGMTGELVWSSGEQRQHPHDRVRIVLDLGELRYRDQRKLQGLWLAEDDEDARRIMGPQGPDALGLSNDELAVRLDGRRGKLKQALMDQTVVAGLGNLLTDELLWHARLNPTRRAGSLDNHELQRLHRAMQRVLAESVRAGCVPAKTSWLTGVRDQPKPECPRCGTALHTERVNGRSSWWCPHCQP